MPRRLDLTRSHAILRLEQDSLPRIQMSLIVGRTGAAGLLFSFIMLGIKGARLEYLCA